MHEAWYGLSRSGSMMGAGAVMRVAEQAISWPLEAQLARAQAALARLACERLQLGAHLVAMRRILLGVDGRFMAAFASGMIEQVRRPGGGVWLLVPGRLTRLLQDSIVAEMPREHTILPKKYGALDEATTENPVVAAPHAGSSGAALGTDEGEGQQSTGRIDGLVDQVAQAIHAERALGQAAHEVWPASIIPSRGDDLPADWQPQRLALNALVSPGGSLFPVKDALAASGASNDDTLVTRRARARQEARAALLLALESEFSPNTRPASAATIVDVGCFEIDLSAP